MPPDARQLANALVGRTIGTLGRGKPNVVKQMRGAHVIVGTETSPGGKPVALRYLQDGLDLLYTEGRVRITPETFGGYRRSSFIGAFLGTLPGVRTTPPPVWVEFMPDGGDAEATNDALESGGPAGRGYPDPVTSDAIDAAGVAIALHAIAQCYGGNEIERMPQNNPGFDVRVRDADGVTLAYVEIKSTAGAEPMFFISERERRFAEEFSDRYHLLVVTRVDLVDGTGDVRWRDGALAGDDVELRARQWQGRLR